MMCEIENMSARQGTLKHCTATSKCWNSNMVVSQVFVITVVKHLLNCARNSWVLTLMTPSVSTATA